MAAFLLRIILEFSPFDCNFDAIATLKQSIRHIPLTLTVLPIPW